MANRAMKDSGVEWIGKIPKNWNLNKVKRYYSVQSGYAFKTKDMKKTDETIPVVRMSNLKGGKLALSDASEINYEDYYENYLLKVDDFIFGMSGSLDNYAIVRKKDLPALLNQRVGKFKIINDDITYYPYVKYIFLSDSYKTELWLSAKGTAQLNISEDNIGNIKFPFPSKEEQQKIAAFLDEKVDHIDNIIEDTKKSIENLKAYKQSLITETVIKGLNPDVEMKDSGIESIGEVPIAWNIEKVKFHSIIDPSYKENDRLPTKAQFVPMDQVKGGYLKLSEVGNTEDLVGKYTYFREGDIVIAKVRPSFENGNIAVATGLKNNLGFGTTEIFTLRVVSNKILTKFLFYYLRNSNFINAASSTMTGVGGLKRISSSFLMNYKIGIPSIEEQSQIVKYLDEKINNINSLLKQKEQLITELEVYKKSLIYEYVTGKKEVE